MNTKKMKLICCMVFMQWCIYVNAYDFERDGIYYSILSEAQDENELGTCEVTQEYDYYSRLESCYEGDIEIPSVVYNPWNRKFYYVVAIGEYAFSESQLSSITLPSSVTKFETGSFAKCKGIASFSFYDGIEYIGDNAFEGSDLSGSLYLPNTCKYIGNSAFSYTDIVELEIQSLSIIYDYDFCIINGAFGYCKNLRKADLNALCYDFQANPFIGCYNLINVEGWGVYTNQANNTGNILIDGCLYKFVENGTERELELICCPSGKNLFENPNSFVENGKSHKLLTIGSAAFAGCQTITYLDIPPTVKYIGDYALMTSSIDNFHDTTYHRIDIPESVESIGVNPFGWFCYNWDIYLYSTKIRDISFLQYPSNGKYGNIHIPYGTITSFNTSHVEKAFYIIDDIGLESVSIELTGNYQTLCSLYDLDFTNVSNLKAYIASGINPSTGVVLLTRVYKVPACEGILLKGDAGDYEIPITDTNVYYTNMLKGVTRATTISPTEGNYTNFILANGSHGIGFYTLSQAGEIAAGKAYLQLPTSAISSNAARGLTMRFDDEYVNPTALKEVENGLPTIGEYYDLQGRRIANGNPNRGLYIMRSADGRQQGKKVFIR